MRKYKNKNIYEGIIFLIINFVLTKPIYLKNAVFDAKTHQLIFQLKYQA